MLLSSLARNRLSLAIHSISYVIADVSQAEDTQRYVDEAVNGGVYVADGGLTAVLISLPLRHPLRPQTRRTVSGHRQRG